MGIDHYVGASGNKYLQQMSLQKQRIQITTFRNDKYIEKLNYIIQLEIRSQGLYKSFKSLDRQLLQKLSKNHIENARIMRKLVLRSGGLTTPPDSMVLAIDISFILSKISTQLRGELAFDTTLKVFEVLERHIQKRYINILEYAPGRDRPHLQAGLFLAKANVIALRKQRAD